MHLMSILLGLASFANRPHMAETTLGLLVEAPRGDAIHVDHEKDWCTSSGIGVAEERRRAIDCDGDTVVIR